MARPEGVCRVIVLGSTGSIGTQTLGVIEHLNGLHARGQCATRYEVVGLAAGRNGAALAEQVRRHPGAELALTDGDLPRARHGARAAEFLVREIEADLVVSAVVGCAGLPATLAAVELGRDVALANKETLVAAGALVVAAAERTGARLLPVDSEHSGVWQCLGCGVDVEERHQGSKASRHRVGPPVEVGAEVARVILTASGGPFRTWGAKETYHATPPQALNHPTWKMGPKVTVDSASLMNKALEVIEAHWLFGLGAGRIGVLVHPQSVVHAIVEFADGSSVAQMGAPDMRTPIQYALERACGGARASGVARRLEWAEARTLEFSPPDLGRFPALSLAYRAIEEGGTTGAVLNGANEAAVGAFLDRAIPFGRIAELVRDAMDAVVGEPLRGLGSALEAGERGAAFVRGRVAEH